MVGIFRKGMGISKCNGRFALYSAATFSVRNRERERVREREARDRDGEPSLFPKFVNMSLVLHL
jgi:hypothetical protein